MHKKYAGFMVLIMILLMVSGCGQEQATSSEPLRVGMELAYPPFETTDEKGEPTGISVDLAYALGEYLGRPVEIENMAFSGLLPALTTHKIDIILSSMTITEERLESVDFSDPYASINLALLLNKNSKANNIQELDQPGMVLAVKKGTTGHIYAEKNLKNVTVNVFDKETACVLEVTQGKADAFMYDQMTILKNWKGNEETTKANLLPFQEKPEQWGIALKKDQPELKNQINAFLKEYKEKGGFDKLAEKYLEEQKKVFDELKIPFFF